MKKLKAYILFSFFFSVKIFASHIVGGELFYDRINDSTYKITLKVYRDCFNGQAPFDGISQNGQINPAILTVYTADSTLLNTYDIGVPVITMVPASINNLCVTPPGGICVQQGVYTYTLTLPPKIGGYYVIYQSCCRNASIVNLVALQGVSYYTFVPGPEIAPVNNSPRYANFPPIFICNNLPFTFDHKAIDPDGDQLVYSICSPFQGRDQVCPNFNTPGCPTAAPPPPYNNVSYVAPYNSAYPIASAPSFSINSTTGVLTGQPNLIGQFVVGICVQEFRGNNLINTHFRDFQFNVVPCIVQVASVFADQIKKCQGSTITFTNQSFGNLGGLTYLWDFGDETLTSDTSKLFNPSYTYNDTGTYVVTLIANPNKPCSDTLKKIVHVYPELDIHFPKVNKQCLKGNAFTFSAQGIYLPNTTFNWNFSASASPSTSILKNPNNIVFNQHGKYFVKLVAKQGVCVDSFIDSVRVIARPFAKINNLPQTLCDPARIGFSNGSYSELPVSYSWLFSNDQTSNQFEPSIVFSPPGIYSATLIVTTNSVCVDTSVASVANITVNPSPKAGFTFSPQPTTIFEPEINFDNEASTDVALWHYNFGDGNSANDSSYLHVYTAPGKYKVIQVVTNNFNCRDTLEQEVVILPEFRFWIPNTFTPNGDLVNEYFTPITYGVTKYEFDVFSGWGELIFSTKTPNEGWNGFYKGRKCEEDIYVWRIKFVNEVTNEYEYYYGKVLLMSQK